MILPFTKSVRVQDKDVTETIENDSESPVTTSHDDAINLMETSTSTSCFPVTGPYDFAILLKLTTYQMIKSTKQSLTFIVHKTFPFLQISHTAHWNKGN